MDRINKFLDAREKKGVKMLRVFDKKYKISKEDVKLVRDYMKCKNLSGFKLDDVKISAGKSDAIECKKIKYDKDMYDDRWLEKNKNKFEHEETEFVEELFDIYKGESLSDFKQEWVYDITTQYEGKVSELFTKDLDELNEFANKYRKPVEKSISIDEIVKFDKIDMDIALIGQHKFGCEKFKKENDVLLGVNGEDVYDMKYGAEVCVKNSFVLKENILYSGEKVVAKNVVEFGTKIIEKHGLCLFVLSKKECKVIDEQLNVVKAYKFKGEIINKMHVDGHGNIYVGGPCGVKKLSMNGEIGYFGFVNYVMDFVEVNGIVFVINNLNRLFCLAEKSTYQIVTGSIGRKIDVHETNSKYLIAVLFTREIKIYSFDEKNKNLSLNAVIYGNYSCLSWDMCLPKLYAADANKINVYA